MFVWEITCDLGIGKVDRKSCLVHYIYIGIITFCPMNYVLILFFNELPTVTSNLIKLSILLQKIYFCQSNGLKLTVNGHMQIMCHYILFFFFPLLPSLQNYFHVLNYDLRGYKRHFLSPKTTEK
jgi:hypothetical protein